MPRALDTATLNGAAEYWASQFMARSRYSKTTPKLAIMGRDYVLQSLFNATFKDEHEYLLRQVKENLGGKALAAFEAAAKEAFAPREDRVFAELLKDRLALDPDGKHIEGAIGRVEVGRRVVDRRPRIVRRPIVRPVNPGDLAGPWKIVGYRELIRNTPVTWPIYAGEGEERIADRIKKAVGDPGPGADPLPDTVEPLPLGAAVTNISAESAIAMLDALSLRFDEGTTAAEIRHRTGTLPADPDAAETGTLLGTNTMSDPAMNAAADNADGSCSATADTISDDASADATGTVGYSRISATGTGADDHEDLNAGETDEAMLFNTASFVAGAVISVSSLTNTLSQGSTAT